MPLEPAGVDLQAKGFKEYIANLETIEKQQREVFDQEFKGTERSFEKTQKAAKDYQRQLDKTANEAKQLAEQEKRLAAEQKRRQQIQGAFIAAGVAFVAREALQFAKESVELAQIQAKAEAQLATAIQSTGGAANLSSRELKNLASELQGLTNFGDEATIQAQALLLTFKDIGRDVFPDATKAILDTATAMDQDLKTTTIQIGKALNEPVEGLSALRRVGIQFTDVQEDLIKNFIETGDKASAQRIILQELNSQFGGSAEAAREADGGVVALGNSFGDFQEQVGFLTKDLNELFGVTEGLIGVFDSLGTGLKGLRSDLGFGDTADALAGAQLELSSLQAARDDLAAGPRGFSGGGSLLSQFLQTIGVVDQEAGLERLDEAIAAAQANLEELELKAAAEDAEELAQATENAANSTDALTDSLQDNEAQIKALQSAVKQAEQIQLSFTRAQEDAARKLERSQAKLADKQFKEQNKLAEKQSKEREDLLQDQIDDLADFEDDRIKQIQKAEKDIAKVRESAGKDRVKQQRDIQRELRQAQERFNLNQIQSQRRFELSDRQLRAEGDILALQQLREDHDLQQQEDKENFDLAQRQNKENTNEQLKELEEQTKQQEQELQERLAELKVNLEEERGVLLQGFDNQLAELEISQAEQKQALIEAQAEQRQALLDSYAEQQEDARINKQRQLEDLGRALADERDLTAEGAMAIASELEAVFGEEGVADTIFGGFTTRTESEFRTLFDSIEGIVKDAVESPTSPIFLPIIQKSGSGRNTLGGLGASSGAPASFDDGGVIPGPIGAPQTIRAHGGETVLPTHKMSLPASLSQALNVNVSGGIDINGAEGASSGVVDAAVEQVLDNFEIAITRMARRHG